MNVDFLPTISVVFLLEYTVMLLLITFIKARSTRTCMCEISSILLKFCARFWQISSKIFVILPQISSNLLNFQHAKRVAILPNYPNSDSANNCSLFIINANLCVMKLFKLSLYQQFFQFKNRQTKEFSRLKNWQWDSQIVLL